MFAVDSSANWCGCRTPLRHGPCIRRHHNPGSFSGSGAGIGLSLQPPRRAERRHVAGSPVCLSHQCPLLRVHRRRLRSLLPGATAEGTVRKVTKARVNEAFMNIVYCEVFLFVDAKIK